MILILLNFVLAIGLVAEQPQNAEARPSGYSSHSDDTAPRMNAVKPEDPVVTVSGVCQGNTTKNSSDCKTVLTRAKFERMVAALATAGQPVSGNGRQQLAQTYVDLLAYEEAARSSGIESSPE